MQYFSRLQQTDRVMNAVVAPYGGAEQTHFEDTYTSMRTRIQREEDGGGEGWQQGMIASTDRQQGWAG